MRRQRNSGLDPVPDKVREKLEPETPPKPLSIPEYAEQLLGGAHEFDGTDQFLIMSRAKDDPICSKEDPKRRKRDPLGWKSIDLMSPEEWMVKIIEQCVDGEARTFNRIMVELSDRTADTCLHSNAEKGIWLAVKEGFLHFNTHVPIKFWRVK